MKRFDCAGSSGVGFGLRGTLFSSMLADLDITARLHALETHIKRGQSGAESGHSGVSVAFVAIFLEFGVRETGFCEGSCDARA